MSDNQDRITQYEDGESIEECASCNFSDPGGYHVWRTKKETDYFCDVCWNSGAEMLVTSPSSINNALVIEVVAKCTNMILQKLRDIHEH